MNSTHAHFNISAREIGAKLKLHGTACPPFWILTVEWFWWRHRFQIASFSPSTLENSVFKKHRFQIAPLWRAFSNGSVFGDRFRRCSVNDSRIRSKTAPFSFENGLVWKGPKKVNDSQLIGWLLLFFCLKLIFYKRSKIEVPYCTYTFKPRRVWENYRADNSVFVLVQSPIESISIILGAMGKK